ncbi:MAG: HAD family phosphatase [Spirochaetes bacterium]|nr:HAD family phosphatase [Spirochaetota bacterium]
MLRAVIFDMDGVIVDSEPHYYKIDGLVFREMGITVSEAEWHSFVGITAETMWVRIRERHRLSESLDELIARDRERRIAYFSALPDLAPIDGIPALLESLKRSGIRIALASSSPLKLIDIILARLGLTAYFEQRIDGDAVTAGKPAPDIFLRAAALLGVIPAECLVIEDSTNGVRAAVAAGMKCVGFRSPGTVGQSLHEADLIVESFVTLAPETLESLFR